MVVSFYDANASGFFFILTNSVKEDCFSLFLSFSYNLRSHIPLSLSSFSNSLSLSLSLSRICIEFHHGVKVVLKTVSPVAVLFLQLDHIVDS